MKVVVVVQCLSVKLKLTLTEPLLQKSLRDAVVEPFLGAYNNRAAVPLTMQELLRVEVDGAACEPSRMAGELLTSEAPTVVLHAPPADAQVLADALTALPASATDEEALVTLRALRRASHDEAAREAVLAPRVVARTVEYAALSAAAPRAWSGCGASAEATVPLHNLTLTLSLSLALALSPSPKPKPKPKSNRHPNQVLLHNLLVLDRDGVGAAMCAPPLAALPQLVATLEAAGELHPARLRFVGHVAFHLSLVAAARPHAAALLRACRLALSSSVDELASATPRDPQASAELAAQLARALFNLLRLEPPTGGAAAARLALDLGVEVTRLLSCTAATSATTSAATAATAAAAAATAAAAADLRDALLEAQLALALTLALTLIPYP
jgi:hypothetical protein